MRLHKNLYLLWNRKYLKEETLNVLENAWNQTRNTCFDLGNDGNQKKISMLEQKDVIEDNILKTNLKFIKIPIEAFQNFDENQAINIILNTFDNCQQVASVVYN